MGFVSICFMSRVVLVGLLMVVGRGNGGIEVEIEIDDF